MAGMITLILTGLLRGVRTQRSLVFENLALRHQLAVLQRTAPRPRLRKLAVSGFASRCSLFLRAGREICTNHVGPGWVSFAAEVYGVRRPAAAGPQGTWMG
jgi:hypothetical protein